MGDERLGADAHPLNALVVHPQSLAPQRLGPHGASPSEALLGEGPEGRFVFRSRRYSEALGGAVLADALTPLALGGPELRLRRIDCTTAAVVRGQKFSLPGSEVAPFGFLENRQLGCTAPSHHRAVLPPQQGEARTRTAGNRLIGTRSSRRATFQLVAGTVINGLPSIS
jgi:hypothetical protein